MKLKNQALRNLGCENSRKRGLCILLLSICVEAFASLDSWQWVWPQPAAYSLRDIAATPGLLVAVGAEGVIQTSGDGQNWTRRYSGVTNYLSGVIHAQDRFVAVGNFGLILTSTDGYRWTSNAPLTWQHLGGIAHGDGQFVVFTTETPYKVFTSSNLVDWIAHPYTNRVTLEKIRYCGNLFVGTGAYGIVTSSNGFHWVTRQIQHDLVHDVVHKDGKFVAVGDTYAYTSPTGESWFSHPISGMFSYALCYGDSNLIAVGRDAIVSGHASYARSTDGTNWSIGPIGSPKSLWGATFHEGKFLGFGEAGTIMSSTDVTNWQTITGNEANLNKIANLDGTYYALGESGQMLISSNGTQWTKLTPATTKSLHGIAKGSGVFTAVGGDGFSATILRSIDGITWTNVPIVLSGRLRGVAFGNGVFVSANAFSCLYSTNGINWTAVSVGGINGLAAIAFGAGQFVTVGGGGRILSSPDGVSWTERTSGTTKTFYDIIYAGGRFLAAGGGSATSMDGITWSYVDAPHGIVLGLAFGDGIYVAGGGNWFAANSSNAVDWIVRRPGFSYGIRSVTYADGYFTGVGWGGSILRANVQEKSSFIGNPFLRPTTIELSAEVSIANQYRLQRSSSSFVWEDVESFTPVQSLWLGYDPLPPSLGTNRFYRLVSP